MEFSYDLDGRTTEESVIPAATPELLELIEKVNSILSTHRANDPEVVELKASSAYQKVAWLLDETVVPIQGRQPQ